MLTVIWVLGTMLLVLLIHFLLPLGYTTKGKYVLVVSSGLIALGGLAATTTIPLWQTFILLLVLSFFTSYIIDSRLGKVMYKEKEQLIVDDKMEDTDTSFLLNKQSEKSLDIELMDLSELEITTSSLVIKQDAAPIAAESLDEDISFLQDRKIESDSDDILVDEELEVAYLSDIEVLLEESSEKKFEFQEEKLDSVEEEGWLDELAELTIVKEEKNAAEEHRLDDFELEELFTDKEVAAASEHDESKQKKVLQLQK